MAFQLRQAKTMDVDSQIVFPFLNIFLVYIFDQSKNFALCNERKLVCLASNLMICISYSCLASVQFQDMHLIFLSSQRTISGYGSHILVQLAYNFRICISYSCLASVQFHDMHLIFLSSQRTISGYASHILVNSKNFECLKTGIKRWTSLGPKRNGIFVLKFVIFEHL